MNTAGRHPDGAANEKWMMLGNVLGMAKPGRHEGYRSVKSAGLFGFSRVGSSAFFFFDPFSDGKGGGEGRVRKRKNWIDMHSKGGFKGKLLSKHVVLYLERGAR